MFGPFYALDTLLDRMSGFDPVTLRRQLGLLTIKLQYSPSQTNITVQLCAIYHGKIACKVQLFRLTEQ